ncbi:ATP-binding cassette domain-containing protein [Micromonospora sp. KC213]|uniref:ABC transporter ATP-binding protein n=1 Tax=Micromonospora sp. KC213 TaxID=2530378 RepID=UPI00104D658C|nr:ATP-binding cassette domain-containing protein [Micromonospora sp. KC213]TDC44279.1 ATP-binding cassette domain-containing protein [Micromonospora sp. KC213]
MAVEDAAQPPALLDFRVSALLATAAERIRLARLLALAGPGLVTGIIAAGVAMATSAPLTALGTGAVVESVVAGRGIAQMVVPLAMVAGGVLLRHIGESLLELLNWLATRRIDSAARSRVRTTALSPAFIDHLADPRFAAEVTRASDQGETWRLRSPGTAATGQVVLLARLVSAVGAAVVVAAYFPWLAVGLLAGSLLIRAITRRQWIYLERLVDGFADAQRRAEYWTELAAGPAAAKEIRLFGLAPWVVGRRREAHSAWATPYSTEVRGILRRQWVTILIAAGASLAALLIPGLAALDGRLSPSGLAECLAAAWAIFSISFMGVEALNVEYGVGAVHALDRLAARYGTPAPRTSATDTAGATAATVEPGPPRVGFEQVRFGYPTGDRLVLDGLDLDIHPGEVLAIVGLNGAGKTTLIKLLAGLHRPQSGRVTVDGVDMARLDPVAWRRRMAVVFQDFVHYPSTLRDNIRMSAPEASADDEAIMAALEAAGAREIIERHGEGLDTPLWRADAGGTDLSGGQWQKIAIARAIFAVRHGRTVLVLDEPTAHLDVAAEAEFYRQVVAAVGDVSVVLISHRLSTIRDADRIVVLSDGRVAEAGSHEELMHLNGTYARLFRLQADRFAGVS